MAGLGGQILGHFWTPEGDERKRLILAKIGSISTCAQNGTKHIQCKFIFQRLFLAAFCALYLTPTRAPTHRIQSTYSTTVLHPSADGLFRGFSHRVVVVLSTYALVS